MICMQKSFQKSLFIFRRDLRLEDNTGLIFALKNSETVIPAFIFTKEQIHDNPYRSDRSLRFMLESLEDLSSKIKEKGSKLFLFEGSPEEIITKCISTLGIDAVIFNKDYTPYSQKRDRAIEAICKKQQISCHSFDDALLHPPQETLKKDGTPYTVFTPYFRNASKLEVPAPCLNRYTNYFSGKISFAKESSFLAHLAKNLPPNSIKGGRADAISLLNKLSSLQDYGLLRDFPEKELSSHLSPYLKFTICSPREAYAAICKKLGSDHDLIRSLYWRDFFTMIALFFPHVFTGCFHTKYDKLSWSYDKQDFTKWCEGKTGFPIVDAGMRQLNSTGLMHNRVRMIVASFLTKDLHIDWRWGEKYFAQKLIDYDPALNNGNWQWAASTGCDAQPYFRIFNPESQQKKFDPECLYIKQWIPELQKLSAQAIHDLEIIKTNYPTPMLCHATESRKTLSLYKAV